MAKPPMTRHMVRSHRAKGSAEPTALMVNSAAAICMHPDAADPVGEPAGGGGADRAAQQRRGDHLGERGGPMSKRSLMPPRRR